MLPTLPVLVELGVASLPDWRSVTHCTCISPGTPLHATRLAQGFASLLSRGRGGGGDCGRCKVVGFFFFSWLGSTEGDSPSPQNVSLSHMQPKRTARLMPYNYAQTMLSDQTSSCSHQVHGVLVFWMHCPIPLPFCCEEQLQLSFFCTENKMVEWLWTFHFFVFGLSTLILYSGTNCVCV